MQSWLYNSFCDKFACISSQPKVTGGKISEEEKKKILADEERELQKLKVFVLG